MATENEQDVAGQIAALATRLNEFKEKAAERSEYQEGLTKIESDITELGLKLGRLQGERNGRRAEANQADLDNQFKSTIGYQSKAGPQAIHKLVSKSDEVKEFQSACDDLHILSTMTNTPIRELQLAREYADCMPLMRKALDTSAGQPWIPTDMSASMHEKVRLSLKVAALHSRINMPTNPYVLPMEGADGTAYLVAEQGGIDDDLDAAKRVPAAGSLQSSPGFTNLTLTAKKLGARVVTSTELTEESIIPILPYLQRKIALAMAHAQEDAVINGKLTGTHFDADVSSASDHRKAWNGYRQFARNVGTASVNVNATTLDISNIRSLRQKMAIYGLNPSELVFVTGGVGYNKFLSLKDGSNPSPLLTVDKYGPGATILTGEVGKVDGIPIILSEFVRENLDNTGVYTGITTTSTLVFLVNREHFLFGDFRAAQLKSRDIIETDQTVLVTLQRLTFRGWFEDQTTVGQLYNLQA